jgi:hypothetical protein
MQCEDMTKLPGLDSRQPLLTQVECGSKRSDVFRASHTNGRFLLIERPPSAILAARFDYDSDRWAGYGCTRQS